MKSAPIPASPLPRLDIRLLERGSQAQSVLARMHFGRHSTDAGAEAADSAVIPLDPLGPAAEELWLGDGPVQTLEPEPGLRLRRSADLLFGLLQVPGERAGDMDRAAHLAYRRLSELLREQGMPHCLRTWNYFHDVTAGDGDDERYRRFCVGRYEALAEPGFEQSLPAATVIGSFVPGFTLAFLAGRQPGIPVENPRQVSAWRYPREYSPRSPSFSRALLFGRQLLVSGTASVVGHATQHPFDASAQLQETHANIGALLAHAQQTHFADEPGFRWQPRTLRLYVRNAALADALRAQAEALFGAPLPLVLLHGEICRRDLEVEIEGVFEAQG